MKTFSRARVAKASLVKLLVDDHEVSADQMQVTAIELEDGRYTAKVDFLAEQPPYVLLDLIQQGWTFTAPGAAEAAAPAAILDMGEAGDATPYPAPTPPTAEELASFEAARGAEGGAQKGTGYIAEASTAEGPTKRVWAISESMPGARRKDVIEACRAAGIAFGTARTQYQKWFSSKKN